MPLKLVPYYEAELAMSKRHLGKDMLQSWRHLERAHNIGQPYPVAHTTVHWEMLKFGIRIKNLREILGQLPRLAFGGIKSFVGTIPTGNTGGADVPPLRPMEIPEDLKTIITNNSN